MKLLDDMSYWRSERPDEWKMDEFIRGVEKLEQERDDAVRAANYEADVAEQALLEVQALKAQVEQLRKQKEQIQLGFDDYKRKQNIADAEIAAKAIEDAIDAAPSRLKYNLPLVDICELYEYANQLRQQVKEWK